MGRGETGEDEGEGGRGGGGVEPEVAFELDEEEGWRGRVGDDFVGHLYRCQGQDPRPENEEERTFSPIKSNPVQLPSSSTLSRFPSSGSSIIPLPNPSRLSNDGSI